MDTLLDTSMGEESTLHLKWGRLKPYEIIRQQGFLQEKLFTDVTLVGDDGIHLKAHKVILSSSSKVFREMLINSPHP